MTTPLTTVSDISEMYAYFSMTEKQLLDLIRQDSTSSKILEKMPPVSLTTADGRPYSQQGKIETISEVIDQTTGSVSVRATFSNPQRLLRSGGTRFRYHSFPTSECVGGTSKSHLRTSG